MSQPSGCDTGFPKKLRKGGRLTPPHSIAKRGVINTAPFAELDAIALLGGGAINTVRWTLSDAPKGITIGTAISLESPLATDLAQPVANLIERAPFLVRFQDERLLDRRADGVRCQYGRTTADTVSSMRDERTKRFPA